MSGAVRYAHGKRNHVMTPAENGPFVRACDYDTLRAQLEAAERFAANEGAFRMAAEARAEAAEAECAAVRAEVASWRKPSPYMHSCCAEAVHEFCDELDAIARTKEQQA